LPNRTDSRGVLAPLGAPESGAELLGRLAERAQLREGAEGTRAMLRALLSLRPATTQAVARACRLPVPVVAALRREMEREGLLARGHGMELTDGGRAFVAELSLGPAWEATCANCNGRRISLSRERAALAGRLQRRQRALPSPDVALDQAHSLPESSLRRALYMAETGALDGRSILCLGDDDCVSLALALLLRSRERPCSAGAPHGAYGACREAATRIVALDCDRRLLAWLAETAEEEGVSLECAAHDLREPLPLPLRGAFDVFQTDPPYTPAGLRLFLARAVEALAPKGAAMGFLSFAHRPPREQQEIARLLVNAGFAIEEIIPDFNEYAGAAILGNRGQILRVRAAGPLHSPVRGRYDGPLYTADCSGKAAPGSPFPAKGVGQSPRVRAAVVPAGSREPGAKRP
jgi:predicted methyltransferase